MMWIGAVALTACMFVNTPRSGEGLPQVDEHAFLNLTQNCTCCHDTAEKTQEIEPHAFTVDITESCLSCHTGEEIGISHPVGVSADGGSAGGELPESLPLDEENRITCGTCHNPHLAGYSTERYAGRQTPAGVRVEDGVEVAYYKSYRLRLHAPEAGGDPTCAACHGDYF